MIWVDYGLRVVLLHLLLWAIYRGCLEGEGGHHFKRGYLLAAMGLGLALPLWPVCWPPSLDHPPLTAEIDWSALSAMPDHPLPPAPAAGFAPEAAISPSWWIRGGYFAVGLVLLAVRGRSLYRLIRQARAHPQRPFRGRARLVLLNREAAPHSFGRWIFVGREAYQRGELPRALLEHEFTHVQQRHSWDLLAVQGLQCLFWFNPCWGLYRRALRLNHEFLADQAALGLADSVQTYQRLLLTHLKNASASPWTLGATYHLTRKRLIMMNKKFHSLRTSLWQSLALLLGVSAAASMGSLTWAQTPEPGIPLSQDVASMAKDTLTFDSAERVKAYFFRNSSTYRRNADGTFCLNEEGKRYQVPLRFMSPAQLKLHLRFLPSPPRPQAAPPTSAQLTAFLNASEYGVWVDGQRVENQSLKNYQAEDFAKVFQSPLLKNAAHYGQYTFHVALTTHQRFEERLQAHQADLEAAQTDWMQAWWAEAAAEKAAPQADPWRDR